MTNDNLELLRLVVDRANGVAYGYDLELMIVEETPDYIKVGVINEDSETTLEAAIRVLGDYSYIDGESYRIIENTLLGVLIDGDENTDTPWRIIDARGTSLFAILYV